MAFDDGSGLHLRSVSLDGSLARRGGFPFDVAAIRSLGVLRFTTPVTFFVGENGSGKSTLLESIAILAELPTVGSSAVGDDPTLAPQRELAGLLRPAWNRRVRRGFFLRAEDFFGFARRMARLRAEMEARLDEIEAAYGDASALARDLAAGPPRASIADMEQLYGAGVDARSHGESFLNLFQSRLVPGGVYLLDEPEAALSPQSQLALLALLGDATARRSQFIIATHSPIVLAFPGATIYSFDSDPVEPVAYDQLEHVTLTRAFLRDPAQFTRRLAEE